MRFIMKLAALGLLVFSAVACYVASTYTQSYPERARDIWA